MFLIENPYVLPLICASFVVSSLLLFIFQDCDFTLLFYCLFYPNKKNYDGKVIWIVGASSGIGEQLAYYLSTRRCKLVLTGTRHERLVDVQKKCILKSKDKLNEADILIASFDVANEQERTFHFNRVIEIFGKIDILINNAGRTHVCEFEHDDQIESLFASNFFGQMHLSRLVLSHWLRSEFAGQIALTSSLLNYYRLPFIHTYSATKRAIHGLYESLRLEYYSKGITFTIVCPGPVSTEIYAKSNIQSEKGHQFESCLDMQSSHCAKLMGIAIANKLNESWITRQPLLYLTYLITSFPTIELFALKQINWFVVRKAKQNFF